MGVLQGAEDLARIFLHSAAAGIPEWAERRFGNAANAAQTDQMVAAARQRTGIAGSLTNAAAYAAPAVAALKGLKAVRAAPAVLGEAIPAAERAVTGLFPQSARSIARARLGLEPLPTMSEQAGRAISNLAVNSVNAIKAHPVLSGLSAAALGASALADYGSQGSSPAKAAPAKPAAQPSSLSAPAEQPSSVQSAVQGNPTFSDLVNRVAAANGGNISLRELSALSDIAYKTSPRQSIRSPSFKDMIGTELAKQAKNTLLAEQAKADELSKTDPAAAEAYGRRSSQKYMSTLLQIMGADPLEQAYAERLAAAQDEQEQ